MKNSLCRNEILEPGQIINTYHTFSWGGRFLGTVELIRHSETNGYAGHTYYTWIVAPIDGYVAINGYVNKMYTTVSPMSITPIIDD